MASKKWQDLSPRARKLIVVSGAAQIALVSIAHADLTKRPDSQVRGDKRLWRWITLLNFVGPLLYFVAGRVPDSER